MSQEVIEKNKVLVTLSVDNINKLDKIASNFGLTRSAVLDLFLNEISEDSKIKFYTMRKSKE